MHSNIVGGSTAGRVLACPGSIPLCAKMPPRPETTYMDKGTMLHSAIAFMLSGVDPDTLIGTTYKGEVITRDLIDDKLLPAVQLFKQVGLHQYLVEAKVDFDMTIPGAFGTADVFGRVDKRVVVLDWKFGDGVMVDADENPQLLFYAAAAMRSLPDFYFDGVDEVECVIIQPPNIRRWTTTVERLRSFELELHRAVQSSTLPNPPMHAGAHCKWCPARAVCPIMTGTVERALHTDLKGLDATAIGGYLADAELLQGWINDLEKLALQMLEGNVKVPGWKLVQKRATRKWTDEIAVKHFLTDYAGGFEMFMELASPARVEKLLGKKSLPEGLVQAVSSGTTLASVDDPRPEAFTVGARISAALSKMV